MIEHDADSADAAAVTSPPASWLHACAGDGRYIIVDIFAIIITASRFNNDGATCNGVPMTALGEKRISPSGLAWIFTYGIIPEEGVNVIEWAWHDLGGSSGTTAWGVSTSYTGVDQITPTASFTSGADVVSGPVSLTVTPTLDGGLVHAAVCAFDDSITAGQTLRNSLVIGGSLTFATEDTGPVSPAAATAMTFSNYSGSSWVATGLALQVAPMSDREPVYFGRFQQGTEVPLTLQTDSADGVTEDPASIPHVTIYLDDGTPGIVETLPIPADLRGVEDGVFRRPLFLNTLYGEGRYLVVMKWLDSGGVARTQLGSFTVLPGGDADGAVIAMYQLVRPDATYLMRQCDSGRLIRGRNPR